MLSIRTVYLLVVARNCKSSVLILPQLDVRNFGTTYSAGPHRQQWGTSHDKRRIKSRQFLTEL